MSSFQLSEESPEREIRRDGTHGRGSKRVVAGDEEGDNGEDRDDKSCSQDEPQDRKPAWKKFLAHVGPGFLVSLAYLDPGNLETDLQAGANHRYELLWVVLIGLAFALIIQSLAANLGVATGKHLAELCKDEYPKYVNYCLWVVAEVAVIAADIPEGVSIGAKFDRNSLRSQHLVSHPSVGRSPHHRDKHSPASWASEIWGTVDHHSYSFTVQSSTDIFRGIKWF
ncbi:hypothetical protein C4D60_Mb11t12890 [Musa balbisiana]|uniref:Metal transporter n=1 Tax=Musa balbisiana TaxID=52838 RepID=A0A4S8J3S0_MUSBA|nr:hypothetical protein C4D60_Mb11t12890 [Musa balbisiana]